MGEQKGEAEEEEQRAGKATNIKGEEEEEKRE